MGSHLSLSLLPIGETMSLLISQHGNPDLSRAVQVEQCAAGIEICIAGYGKPVYLELDDHGEPILRVFAEADCEDASHVISLARAKESPPAI